MKYDLIIIGAGAAGFSAAVRANELGKSVLLIDDGKIGIGGTCVNVGCLPTKYLLNVAKTYYRARNITFKGLKISASINFKEIMDGKDEVVRELRDEKYVDLLKSLENVEFLDGRAELVSGNEVRVDSKVYRGENILIATGSSTNVPNIPGLREVGYITHIEALNMRQLPSSIIVIGGGPLGVEFSQIFSRFGADVTILQRDERIVKREDADLANMLKNYLLEEGIKVYTNVKIKKVYREGLEKVVEANVDGELKRFSGEEIFLATGRRPNTSNMGLEKVGIRFGKRGEILTNIYMRANKYIWAAGDVTGEPMLETIAAREGWIAANNALNSEKVPMNYTVVPHAIFTDPELAGVGLTDYKASEIGIPVDTRIIPMEHIPKAKAIKATKGAVKIVINKETGKIIGIHILSENAADLIHEATMIVKCGLKVEDVIATTHVFPTLSEAIKIAAQSFKRDITKMPCCLE